MTEKSKPKKRKARLAKKGLDWLVSKSTPVKKKKPKDTKNLLGAGQPRSKLRELKVQGQPKLSIEELDRYKKVHSLGTKTTPAKNRRLRAVMESKRKRLAGEKPTTEVKIKPKKTKAQKKKTKKQQINASIMADGLEATKKKFGAKLVESFMPTKIGKPRKGYNPTAELSPAGHPMTGKLGGRGGLSFKSGGKIIAKNGGGKTMTKTVKGKTPSGGKYTTTTTTTKPKKRKARLAKKGLDWLVKEVKRTPKDIMPKKKPKDRSNIKSGVAKVKTSVQEPKGKIKTQDPSADTKTVSKVQKVYKKGGFKTRRKVKKPKNSTKVAPQKVMGPGGRASQGPKQAAAIKKNIIRDDIRRNIKRGALGAAALITADKLIGNKLKQPPMAATDTSSSGGSYKVKSGDTLSMIAKEKGTTLAALLKANNIPLKEANKLRIGQPLKIPAKVKKRKSVYQGMKKSEMKKIAMPKKKKMGGGKVYRRGGGKALRGFGKATYSNKLY